MNDTLSNSLDKAYDIDSFNKVGHELIDLLSDHLRKCKEGVAPVVKLPSPDEEHHYWREYEYRGPIGLFKDVIDRSIHTHHKRYIGHQVSAPAYISALSGLVSELLNTGMGVYEMGAAGTAIEKCVIEEFCHAVGYSSDEGDGFLTSGGTLANLTALLAARASLDQDRDGEDVIIVSDQAHFCIDRAAMTMGLKHHQVIKVATDSDFSVDIEQVKESIKRAKSDKQNILAVVGCACSTSTGSYDNITALAEICIKEQLWLHVDGAHGGAAAWSSKYKHLVQGISHADSIIIDAHKMMMTPALATAVLFKKENDSYKALAIKAEYLWDKKEGEWYNLAKRTYETTKLMMSIKIYSLIKSLGHQVIDDYVTRQYNMARVVAGWISSDEELELGHQPMSNIICFRYLDGRGMELNELNLQIRACLLSQGDFYIVQTTLHDHVYLRITIMSPYTTLDDIKELISEVKLIGRKLADTGLSE